MSDLSLVAIGTIFSDFKTTFVGKSLENSEPVLNKKGRPIFRKGNLCGVTKLRYQSGKIKALRMWQSESVNSRGVCEHISKYIEQHPAPYLLNMSYLSNSIYFNGEYFSALLMDWCDGRSLKEFINIHINDIKVLLALKTSLFEMFKDMNQRGISHGDHAGPKAGPGAARAGGGGLFAESVLPDAGARPVDPAGGRGAEYRDGGRQGGPGSARL